KLVPADGVYAVLADLCGRSYSAVLNIGHRPTFSGDRRTIEAHILDLREAIHGEQATVHFLDRLRPERRFDSPEELAAQIGSDVENARRLLRNLDTNTVSDV
ncbi:MAG: riboflavin kinase, partial [candidate division WOR-3 bacterium]